jgi:hypothetical protein
MPEARFIAIAVIGEVPSAVRPMVRYRFRQVAPDAAILLDMQDTMRKQFKVVPDVPNVAVLDKVGRLRFTASGNLGDTNYRRLVAAIDELRGERYRTVTSDATARTRPIPNAGTTGLNR